MNHRKYIRRIRSGILTYLKSALLITLSAAFLTVLSSCGERRLNARTARKALMRECAFRDSSQVTAMPTGYFEITAEARPLLDSLTKAGLIKCRITEVKEQKKIEKYTWWEGTTVSYSTVTHYFADISLTDEGRKYTVTAPPVSSTDEDGLPIEEETDSAAVNIAAADAQDTGTEPQSEDDVAAVVTAIPMVTGQAVVPAGSEAGKSPYAQAVRKIRIKKVNLLTGFLKVKKIFHISCTADDMKRGTATCEFVYSYEGVTTPGRILTSHRDGEMHRSSASFRYYLDTGWTVSASSVYSMPY